MTPRNPVSSGPSVLVVGAGIIGLSIGFELMGAGCRVEVREASEWPASGASAAAAGMLGATAEAALDPDTPDSLLALMRESADLWPHFMRQIGTGDFVDACDTFVCAASAEERVQLQEVHARLSRTPQLGRRLELMPGAAARMHAPWLSEGVSLAMRIAGEGQVDAQAVCRGLAMRLGERLVCGVPVMRLALSKGVWSSDDGDVWDHVVVATGCARLPDFEVDGCTVDPGIGPLHAVRGQVVELAPDADSPIQGVTRFAGGYVAAKPDRIILGASSDRDRWDVEPDDAITARLLARGAHFVPAVSRAGVAGVRVGLRPALAGGAPVIGPGAFQGLHLALGHLRNGVLLAPVTADRVRRNIVAA